MRSHKIVAALAVAIIGCGREDQIIPRPTRPDLTPPAPTRRKICRVCLGRGNMWYAYLESVRCYVCGGTGIEP